MNSKFRIENCFFLTLIALLSHIVARARTLVVGLVQDTVGADGAMLARLAIAAVFKRAILTVILARARTQKLALVFRIG